MNFILCSEGCRWQQDGLCTLQDITRVSYKSDVCRHFEPPLS